MLKKKKDDSFLRGTKCKCGYFNQEHNVKRYGVCKGCGEVLDAKAKFDYEMICRLRLWRKK
jgi:hypothetical protein